MREDRMPRKMLHTKLDEKRPRGKPRIRYILQIRKVIEIRGGNWEKKVQENRKWGNRGGWRFLCNIRTIPLEMT